MKRAKTSGFILCIFAGCLNLLIGLAAIVTSFAAASEVSSFGQGLEFIGDIINLLLIVLIVLFVVIFINFLGSILCRNHRVGGGIMVLLSALILGAASVFVILGIREVESLIGPGISVFFICFLIIQVLSLIGALICFAGPSKTR